MSNLKAPDRHLKTALFAANSERQRTIDILGKELDEAIEADDATGNNHQYLKGRINALRGAINKIKGG